MMARLLCAVVLLSGTTSYGEGCVILAELLIKNGANVMACGTITIMPLGDGQASG